jgi:hypothetical protein
MYSVDIREDQQRWREYKSLGINVTTSIFDGRFQLGLGSRLEYPANNLPLYPIETAIYFSSIFLVDKRLSNQYNLYKISDILYLLTAHILALYPAIVNQYLRSFCAIPKLYPDQPLLYRVHPGFWHSNPRKEDSSFQR